MATGNRKSATAYLPSYATLKTVIFWIVTYRYGAGVYNYIYINGLYRSLMSVYTYFAKVSLDISTGHSLIPI